MDSLNTIPNSGSFGDVSAKLNDNFSKVGQSLTTLENVAIANKGYFDTLASLQAAFPSPKAGNIAYVANVASSTGYYIYNVVSGVWTATTTEAPAVGVAISNYAQHGYSSSPKTLKQVDDEVVQLSGNAQEISNSAYGFLLTADSAGNVLSLTNNNGIQSKQEEEKSSEISLISDKTTNFEKTNQNIYLIIDNNGYASFAIDFFGNALSKDADNISDIMSDNYERDVRINSEMLLMSSVVSDLRYKHAFSPYLVFGTEGVVWMCYGASIHLDEADRTDDYTIELVRANLFDLTEKQRYTIATHNEVFKGAPVSCSYNNQLYKFGNNIYAVFSVMPSGASSPQFALKIIDTATMGIGPIQALRLLYDSIDVEFTVNNYLKMIFDKGYVSTLDVAPPTQNTIDNPNVFEKNGTYYWILSMDDLRPFIMMSSTDMINWSFVKKLNIADTANEISALEKDDKLYISYRNASSMRWVIYDNVNNTVLSSGVFANSILSKSKTFSYNGRIFFAINAKSDYFTSEYYPVLGDITNRVQVNIYEVVDNSIVEFSKMTNPYGCHYFDIVPHGTDEGRQSLYMVFSEDRRLLFPQRQFSNISFTNLTSKFLKRL